jgi:hypothetical protein
MRDWSHGDLTTEFEQRLDELLAEVSPGWRAEEPTGPDSDDRRFEDYQRLNLKRARLGDALAAEPDTARALAERVLAAIACDEDVSYNKQLLLPVLRAVGRRTVQRFLIDVVQHEPAHKKVCAVRAWYWSQVSLVYDSVEAFREHQPTRASRAADDEVADLRSHYRNACLAAFVACDHTPTREWLARGFLLVANYYPPNMRDLVARALAIAEADRTRYKDLLAKNDDDTNMGQIGSIDT